jgi:phosphopantothenoylcysteine decarboxylase/phosphopantothenate--cysteine ligase
MHTEMWEHPAVQENLDVIAARGVHVVPPEEGRLAGGDVGAGRLADPDTIVATVGRVLGPNDLAGWKVLVTAGGTREPIDSVRVVSNRSSGKQGYALAAEAAHRGATVTLVTTVDRPVPPGVAEVVRVGSAAEMQAAVLPRAAAMDVVVMAAAVADFRPAEVVDRKIKKADGLESIGLVRTHDFLVDLGDAKPSAQVLVGFAAETDDVLDNAQAKLDAKRLDLIVANDVGAEGVGFEHDTNSVVILANDGMRHNVPLTDKRTVARAVFDAVVDHRGRSRR